MHFTLKAITLMSMGLMGASSVGCYHAFDHSTARQPAVTTTSAPAPAPATVVTTAPASPPPSSTVIVKEKAQPQQPVINNYVTPEAAPAQRPKTVTVTE